MQPRSPRVSALDDIGDKEAPVGSLPWARYFVALARERKKDIEADAKHLRRVIQRLEEGKAWEAYGVLSFDILCEKEIGLKPEDVAAVKKARPGTTLGVALGRHGGDRKSDRAKDQDSNTTLIGKRDKSYTVARLLRDRPDLAMDVKDGRKSANAAAIEAGFRKRTVSVVTTPEGFANAAQRHLSQDQIEVLFNLVSAMR